VDVSFANVHSVKKTRILR